jgi:DNA-binding PadR family transcriptional regulator
MNRDPLLPLTETVYYILLALMEPGHGYAIMARVESMSAGAVRLAPGTLYGALENLVKQRLIVRIESADPRRKVYIITQMGHTTLTQDAQRMTHMVRTFEQIQGGAQQP